MWIDVWFVVGLCFAGGWWFWIWFVVFLVFLFLMGCVVWHAEFAALGAVWLIEFPFFCGLLWLVGW